MLTYPPGRYRLLTRHVGVRSVVWCRGYFSSSQGPPPGFLFDMEQLGSYCIWTFWTVNALSPPSSSCAGSGRQSQGGSLGSSHLQGYAAGVDLSEGLQAAPNAPNAPKEALWVRNWKGAEWLAGVSPRCYVGAARNPGRSRGSCDFSCPRFLAELNAGRGSLGFRDRPSSGNQSVVIIGLQTIRTTPPPPFAI